MQLHLWNVHHHSIEDGTYDTIKKNFIPTNNPSFYILLSSFHIIQSHRVIILNEETLWSFSGTVLALKWLMTCSMIQDQTVGFTFFIHTYFTNDKKFCIDSHRSDGRENWRERKKYSRFNEMEWNFVFGSVGIGLLYR